MHLEGKTPVTFSKKIVHSKPNNYDRKNYCVALSGPPLGLNDYSLKFIKRISSAAGFEPARIRISDFGSDAISILPKRILQDVSQMREDIIYKTKDK